MIFQFKIKPKILTINNISELTWTNLNDIQQINAGMVIPVYLEDAPEFPANAKVNFNFSEI